MRPGATNYETTSWTPTWFRRYSAKFGGFRPELNTNVFDGLTVVDAGDIDVGRSVSGTLERVAEQVRAITTAGSVALTIGGNSGPSTIGVLKGIASAGHSVALLHCDAHGDLEGAKPEDLDDANPQVAGTWVGHALSLDGVRGDAFVHFGLRGPRNSPKLFDEFHRYGVARDQIVSYRELAR